MKWKPIESAPKDGKLFLVWVHAKQYGVDENGQTQLDDTSFADIGWWRTGTDPVPYGYVDYGTANSYDMEAPTHWMPLPEPPEGE